ncbi:MAG: hypothetical protein Q8R91_10425 [Candidatus Omnitrophota bacterium]|nr:hypothetical protein [Candidatus Omnitrophota bacterium]
MRSPRDPLRGLVGLLLCAGLGGGCNSQPTYPKERLAESLQRLLTQEHLNASVRFVEHTVAVQYEYPGALIQIDAHQFGVGPAFDEAIRKVLFPLHRVLLSSDAPVDFYVLLMSDPKFPGAYLTMVRYLDDVRRANANMLDTPEMFARTLFELNLVDSRPLTLDQYLPRDILMEEFLSWQLARRIQAKLTEELYAAGVAEVGRCAGEFRNKEFVFTLNVTPPSGTAFDDATIRRIFETSTNQIAQVLSSYRFHSFDAIRLIHPSTGRHLVLPKARLDVFR